MSTAREGFQEWFHKPTGFQGAGCWTFVFGGALMMAFLMLPCALIAYLAAGWAKDILGTPDAPASAEALAIVFGSVFLGGVLLLLTLGVSVAVQAVDHAVRANAFATMRLAEVVQDTQRS